MARLKACELPFREVAGMVARAGPGVGGGSGGAWRRTETMLLASVIANHTRFGPGRAGPGRAAPRVVVVVVWYGSGHVRCSRQGPRAYSAGRRLLPMSCPFLLDPFWGTRRLQ